VTTATRPALWICGQRSALLTTPQGLQQRPTLMRYLLRTKQLARYISKSQPFAALPAPTAYATLSGQDSNDVLGAMLPTTIRMRSRTRG
jgi:hypothetical protein